MFRRVAVGSIKWGGESTWKDSWAQTRAGSCARLCTLDVFGCSGKPSRLSTPGKGGKAT